MKLNRPGKEGGSVTLPRYGLFNAYTGCPKKVETHFNFLAIDDKHEV